jgi:hypothetical protein
MSALAATTHARNQVYESFATVWHDCHAKNPRGLPSHLSNSDAGIGAPIWGRWGLNKARLIS